MSASALTPLQQAVFAALNVSALTSRIDRLGDSVPEGNVPGRYVLIGEMDELPDRTLEDGAAGRGHDVLFTIHSYAEDTRDRTGNKTVLEINNAVVELLDDVDLAVAGHTTVTCELEAVHLDPRDGTHRHIAADFRVILEDA